MKFRKFFTAVTVLTACALILTSCGKDSTEETTYAETTTAESTETTTEAVSEDIPEDVSDDVEDEVVTEEEVSANPLQPIADAALAVGEWPVLWEVTGTDPTMISDFFLLDAENENYQNLLILQCPMSANMTEIILIQAEDVSAAKADLEARRKKAQEQDAFYPDDIERAGASIVGTEGDYAYFLMGDNASAAETEIVNYIKNME